MSAHQALPPIVVEAAPRAPVWIGVDLSSRADMTAWVVVLDGKPRFHAMPGDDLVLSPWSGASLPDVLGRPFRCELRERK